MVVDSASARPQEAADLFRSFVVDPYHIWDSSMHRQADKLVAKRDRLMARWECDADDVARRILGLAVERSGSAPPVYVTGLGGSGSNWLTGMLGSLPGFFDAGEVYFPPGLIEAMTRGGVPTPVAVDAIHLLHARREIAAGDRAANCAAGAHKTAMYHHWDPASTVVYLFRDPRDQVLSTTFRKDEFRRWVAPEASDAEYLGHRCRVNRADRQKYLASGEAADVEVRYEDVRTDPAGELKRILTTAGGSFTDEQVDQAVRRHDASRLRAGLEDATGNLDLGGIATRWQDSRPAHVAPIHSELLDIIESLGYPFGFCVLPPVSIGNPGDVPLSYASPQGTRFRRWDGSDWVFESTSRAAVLAEVMAVHPGQPAAFAAAMVHSVCAARLGAVPDEWLEAILTVDSLRELDMGTLAVSSRQLDVVCRKGTSLRALNLWGSPAPLVEEARRRLPATTVVG